METEEKPVGRARFEVENVGGIDETGVTLDRGVTVLVGRNATNRTSFLESIAAAMGSERATLKGDADRGRVTLDLGGTTYERTLTQTPEGVRFSGEGYLNDPSVADLFAFLDADNEVRRSVERGGDLRELVMRPVDVSAIESAISRLESEKSEINDELATIESRKRDLPELERERERLRERIDEKRSELAELESVIDEESADLERNEAKQEELESKLGDLRETRTRLQSIRDEIESQRESISALERDQSELETELDELPEAPGEEGTAERIERLRERRQRLNEEMSELQSVVQYNEQRLADGDGRVVTELDATGGAVTDQLLEDTAETVTCWTCGSTVEREQIESTVDRLDELRRQKATELGDVKSELDELQRRRREAREKRERRSEIQRELDEIDAEIQRRRERIETLEDDREAATAEVERLETDVSRLESEDFDEILALHEDANELEFEIGRLESELDDVTDEIEEIEALLDRAEELRSRREELVEELTRQRTRIDRTEADAVEAFNEHMDAVLDVLAYDNLERIWIERIAEDDDPVDGATTFELHVVRTTENGTAYEDTLTHLSESEREVTGLVFALAGYLVHDLHESVPFVLLDSLEAIDSDRIARLVDYFADYADYLVVALLPEDAQALSDEYDRVSSI
jgi:peptidoglycan hydrolase CwlO-like protein